MGQQQVLSLKLFDLRVLWKLDHAAGGQLELQILELEINLLGGVLVGLARLLRLGIVRLFFFDGALALLGGAFTFGALGAD